MYIRRHAEWVVARIARRKAVLVITGARQVGKSTMLKEIFGDIRYVALDNPLVRQSVKDSPSIFFARHSPPVIVDEIQKAPELFEYVKDMVDQGGEKGSFYLTGSQSLSLMKNVSESLAGRAGIIKMPGLSLRELLGLTYREPFKPGPEHDSAMAKEDAAFDYQRLLGIIHKGSFPELYETESDLKDWSDYHSSYFQTYIEKDIRELLNIQDETAFIKFVKAAASLTGGLLNYATLAAICGKDEKTVKKWLSALESSGLIWLLPPYHNNLSKRLVKTPKLYFADTGLACFLLGWNTPKQLTAGAMWGHIFETFVVGEVMKSYYNDGIGNPPLYFYRDKDKCEIDLIVEEGDTLYPVEIKTTSDPTSSMVKNFTRLGDIPGKKLGDGALICMAREFLPLTASAGIVPAHRI